MKHLALLVLLSVIPFTAFSSENIQVFIQGENQQKLVTVLSGYQGTVTHWLPMVDAIGGTIPAHQLNALELDPGLRRVVADLNPEESPEQRPCPLGGSLEIIFEASRLSWDVFNFSEQKIPLQSISVDWPAEVRAPSVIRLANQKVPVGSQPSSRAEIEVADIALPPGRTAVEIDWPSLPAGLEQSALSIVLSGAECDAKSTPAYPNYASDYYFTRLIGADQLHAQDVTGSGATVAIVDSGLWNAGPLIQNREGLSRVPAQYNAISDTEHTDFADASGHGSLMSGIIGDSRKNSGGGYRGVAPDAEIIPITVFDGSGHGDFLDILRGLQWIYDHHEALNIRIVNMSLAAAPRFSYWDEPINQAVLKLWQAGLVVVAAAGNEGPDWGSIGAPGNNPYVITVGAMTDSWTLNDRDDDFIPDFSSRGPTEAGHLKPDLLAPGGHITGLAPPQSTLVRENPQFRFSNGDYVSTGTSQSAAVVSGIVALLLQIDPALTNDQVKCLLLSSARPAINRDGRLAYSPLTQGAGLVDIPRIMSMGTPSCELPGGDINAAVNGEEKLLGPVLEVQGVPWLPEWDGLISPVDAIQGMSQNRRWGVEDHLLRIDFEQNESSQAQDVPVDWLWIWQNQ